MLSIGGRISGTVTMEGGGAATGGSVYVYDEAGDFVTCWGLDEFGQYTIGGLIPGTYFLSAWYFDWAASEWYDDATSLGTATPVVVASGETAIADFELAPGGEVSGTVSLEGGGAATGGWVNIVDSAGDIVDSADVDGLGHYVVGGLPAGTYYAEFLNFNWGATEWYDDAVDFDSATPFTVTAGETTTIDAELALAGRIAGTVTLEGGGAATGGHVLVTDAGGNGLAWMEVDEHGWYETSSLAAGTYYAEFLNFDWGATEWYDNAVDFATATPFTVTAGETTTIDVELALAGAISGTVTMEGGGAVSGGAVSAFDEAGGYIVNTSVDEEGHYLIGGLETGAYYVKWNNFDGPLGAAADEWYDDAVTMEAGTLVSVKAGETTTGIDAELALAGMISGTVTMDGGGVATGGGVLVTDSTGHVVSWVWADEDGGYVEEDLAAGTYRVSFWAFDGALAEWYDDAADVDSATPVVVVAGEATTVNGELAFAPTTGAISGTVTVEGGGVATGGVAYVWDEEYSLAGSVPVDAGGNYAIGSLLPGTYYVQFNDFDLGLREWYSDADSFYSATPVVVSAGATAIADAELALGGKISGTVTIEGGGAALGILEIRDAANAFVLMIDARGSGGTYETVALPPGQYYVHFSSFPGLVGEWSTTRTVLRQRRPSS